MHPTAEAVRNVVATFDRVIATHPSASVNMQFGNIFKNSCGTSACHAGWYRMDKIRHKLSEFVWASASLGFFVLYDGNQLIDFKDGAQNLAKDLGFNNAASLELWAWKNHDLWGNEYGIAMFGRAEAFGEREETITLRHIRDHWAGVAERLSIREAMDGIRKIAEDAVAPADQTVLKEPARV